MAFRKVIEVKNLKKSYVDLVAVNDIGFMGRCTLRHSDKGF